MGAKKRNNRKRRGCFRRQDRLIQVIIICYHAMTLVILVVVLALTIYSATLQKQLMNHFKGRNVPHSHDVEYSIYGAVAIRLLAVFLGFYSVKTRHSPAIVMALTAIVFVVSIIMLVAGISIFIQDGTGIWVRGLLQKEMDQMQFPDEKNEFVRSLHSQRKCCGIDSYKDWQSLPYGITSLCVPSSCCLPNVRVLNNTEDKYCGQNLLPESKNADQFVYTQGCLRIVTEEVKRFMKSLASICIILGIMDALLAAFGVFLVMKEYV